MRGGFDGLILDMDGVLLDTVPSFTACVVQTARACSEPPGLGGDWSEAEVERLRLSGGFNNDWDGAAAMALLGPASGPGDGWARQCAALRASGGGPGAVVSLVGAGRWDAMRAKAEPAFQRLYAGPRSLELYGLAPTEPAGLCERERPLATPSDLSGFGLPVGIFTGRTWKETELGMERLGLRLPPGRIVCDTEARFRKPRPDGLLALAKALCARHPLYVGDTVDDLAAALNARDAGLDVAFAGVAQEGSERALRFARGGAVLVRASLRQILGDLAMERPLSSEAVEEG